tara:strand:- start:586 stop:1455 length:870 start_codon:yes stop_codon:yes gene_type:complete
MSLVKKIPGPLLVFLGAFFLSFGGLIVKSFDENTSLWQILFWRQVFFAIIVVLYLLIIYKKKIFASFYNSGFPGLVAGFILALGFSSYVFSMYKTTVANTNFIITTETIFLALFGYFFLKEKINLITLLSIFFGMAGVILIIGSSLSFQSNEEFIGNIVAFVMPISFAILIIIIRKYPNVDMVPAQFTAGVVAAIIGFFIASELSISYHDLLLAFVAGFFQVGLGFILITIGSQTTPSAVVGILMLSEAVFGPFWAWLFINETLPKSILLGGGIIIFSILLQSFYGKNN